MAIPTTLPEASNTGPPEDPGEIGAVIWIRRWPSSLRIALTSPSLTVFESPLGLEMIATRSPIPIRADMPSGSACRPEGRSMRFARACPSWNTTRSRPSSKPRTPTTSSLRPSPSVASTRIASSSTWKLLAASPSRVSTNPVPWLSVWLRSS